MGNQDWVFGRDRCSASRPKAQGISPGTPRRLERNLLENGKVIKDQMKKIKPAPKGRAPAGQNSEKAASPMPMRGRMRKLNAKKQLNNWPAWPVFNGAERKLLLEVLESGQWWFGESPAI